MTFPPPFTMRLGRQEDVPRLVEIYFSAFGGSYIQRRFLPKESPQSWATMRGFLEADVLDRHARFWVVVKDGDDGGEIVSYAKWVQPLEPGTAVHHTRPSLEAWPSDGYPAAAISFFNDLVEQHRRIMSDPATGEPRAHWYLALLATHKDFQGRGLASQLLRWGEQQADAASLPCFLEATPAGRPLYESTRHGYRAAETKTYDAGENEICFMIRDARPEEKDKTIGSQLVGVK